MQQLVLHLGSNAVKFTPAGERDGVPHRDARRGRAAGGGHRHRDPGGGAREGVRAVLPGGLVPGPSLRRRGPGTGGLQVHRRVAWGAHHGRERSRPRLVLHRGAATAGRAAGGVASDSPTSKASADLLEAGDRDGGRSDGRARGLPAGPRAGRGRSSCARRSVSTRARCARQASRPGSGVVGWVAEHRRPVCVAERRPSPARSPARGASTTGPAPSCRCRCWRATGPAGRAQRDRSGLRRALRRRATATLLLQLAERMGATWAALRRDGEAAGGETAARALRTDAGPLRAPALRGAGRVRLARALAHELGLNEAEVAHRGLRRQRARPRHDPAAGRPARERDAVLRATSAS